ncbi:hypothetical protein ASE71_17600 [Ensifer sp. Root954]|nr:hypothetical protein ASD49_32510 [Ensifer sp. Root1298]KQX80401.1 hypothetical protein ASD41_06830 [Ensifer sp. Root1312]KRC18906.1 hypothetical protein ASE29_07040 [Ensifer sp. Root74]KRD75374.1 hypothetical protein ASE71_17600 [Ensifer sp. Root954]
MTAHGRLKTVLFIAALLLPAIDAAEQAAILRPYAFPKPAEPHIDRPLTLSAARASLGALCGAAPLASITARARNLRRKLEAL